jgi:endonuclease YncB( thermonuclease family)
MHLLRAFSRHVILVEGSPLKTIVSSIVLVGTLVAAHAGMAQQAASGDVEYCRTLAKAYLSQNSVQATPNVADATLADGCTGDVQGATASLKRKLADHGIDLPKQSTIAAGDGAPHSAQ